MPLECLQRHFRRCEADLFCGFSWDKDEGQSALYALLRPICFPALSGKVRKCGNFVGTFFTLTIGIPKDFSYLCNRNF